MSATKLERIQLRIRLLEIQLDALRSIESAIAAGREYTDGNLIAANCPDRILVFLRRNPHLAFTPKEIRAAVAAGEETLRKALTRLRKRGLVERAGYARWRLTPAREVAG